MAAARRRRGQCDRRRGAVADLQSAGRRRIAADDRAALFFGAETDLDRPPLSGPKIAEPPAKLPARNFRRRIAAEVRQSVGHVHDGRHVLGRQIAGIGKIDLIGQRAADAGRGRAQ